MLTVLKIYTSDISDLTTQLCHSFACKSTAVGTGEPHSSLDVGSRDRPSFEVPDLAEPSTRGDPQNAAGSMELSPGADEENSGGRLSEPSPEEAVDQEDEWEDEEEGEQSEGRPRFSAGFSV